jgi:urease accessory protein
LTTLHRRAPLLVQQALYWDEEMPGLPCVSIISNSGGILQGDRNVIEVDLAPGAQGHVTTQAATRVHEMDSNYATQTQDLVLGSGSYLEYIPHPLIPYKGSRFVQCTKISIDPTATLIYSEILALKRTRMARLFHYDLFLPTVRRHAADGTSLFTEKSHLIPAGQRLASGAMGSFRCPRHNHPAHAEETTSCRRIEPAFNREAGLASGASRLPYDAGLVFKVLGFEAAPVSAAIRAFWSLARQEVVGARVPDIFLWA